MKQLAILLFALFLHSAANSVEVGPSNQPVTFEAQVIDVIDGDTVKVSLLGKTVNVRLNGIDAPEIDQPFGQESKAYLRQILQGTPIYLNVYGKDKNKRWIADIVTPNGLNLNQLSVSNGYSWWYAEYTPNDITLKALHEQARNSRKGLWGSPTPVAPWVYRQIPATPKAKTFSNISSNQTQPDVKRTRIDPNNPKTQTGNPSSSSSSSSDIYSGGADYFSSSQVTEKDRYYSQGRKELDGYGATNNRTGAQKTNWVNGYTRKDGTYVRGHYRSK